MNKFPTAVQVFCRNLDNKNIYNYYLLPLLDINVAELGVSKCTTYISKKEPLLYAGFNTFSSIQDEIIRSNSNFLFSVEISNKHFFVFKIPDLMVPEVDKIKRGKVLTLLEPTKQKICRNSGLPYNVKEGAFVNSHIFLQALYKNSPIRRLLAEYIGEDIGLINEEVIAPIPPYSDIYIENFIGR